ncbi:MAG: hypothetical protein U5K69_24265 [Balneolaceae bacterium]|nr:hypothetical protein [Balneolaceae bacterium]
MGICGTAVEEIHQLVDRTAIPPGLTARIAGQNEEMSASFQSLVFALALAIFLVISGDGLSV